MFKDRCVVLFVFFIYLIIPSQSIHAEDIALGEIIDAKGDEFIRRDVAEPWQVATTGMQLYKGDELRTGKFGALALLFDDETQVRLHRSSYFVVNEIRNNAREPSTFTLLRGALWSRAKAVFRAVTDIVDPNPIVEMNTPTATIGIRGTDWYVNVDSETGASRVVLLSGEAQVKNEFGQVSVASGEEATVKPGEAPVKRVIVDFKDKPLFALEYNPDWLDLISLDGVGTDNTDSAAIQRGLAAARSGDYSTASAEFQGARQSSQTRTRQLGELGQVAILMLQEQYAKAKQQLNSITPADIAEVPLFQSNLEFFAGDYPETIRLAESGAQRFPADSRFDEVLANVYLVTGEKGKMRSAIDSALNKAPDSAVAWHLDGLYYSSAEPDADKAINAYQKAIESNPAAYASLGNLAGVYQALGDFDRAGALLEQAEANSAGDPLVTSIQGDYAQSQDYLEQAESRYQAALAVDPGLPGALYGQAQLALSRGDTDRAVELFLQLVTVNPDYPGAHTGLAIAYYQAGRRSLAQATIERAIELDPNDPVAPKIGAAFALDNADIAKAIPLAQDALEKSVKFDYFAVESLASARSGLTNIGSAYQTLGLGDWANYYAQLAFTPYLADGHILLSSVYGSRSSRATNSALNLALTLEPTAVSAPNRFFQFVREPDDYLTLSGSLGDTDGATFKSGAVTAQGFRRLPQPLSYRLSYSTSDDNGFLNNSFSKNETLDFSVGTRLPGRKHHLLASLFASKTEAGNPGTFLNPDPDDVDETNDFNASLSYHLRLAYDNRILARVGYWKSRQKFENGAAFGSVNNPFYNSLLQEFGGADLRDFNSQGFTNITASVPGGVCGPGNAFLFCFGVGTVPFAGPAFTLPASASVDLNPIVEQDISTETTVFQFRHLFKVNDVDLSYGVEITPQRETNSMDAFVNFDTGFDVLLVFPGITVLPFSLFDSNGVVNVRTKTDIISGQAYTQARWKATDDLWLEGGLAVRHFDNSRNEPQTDIDPRLGIGYRITPHHWLRAAYQSELVMPEPPQAYLAPVATMGLVTPINQFTFNGTRVENLQLQWDGQWNKRVFTSVRLEQQYIDSIAIQTFFGNPDEARTRTAELGLNVWLLERFGLSAKYTFVDSENRTRGADFGNELPSTPEDNFAVSLNYIHPRQITASVSTNFVGKRFIDTGNTTEFPSYWTTNLGVNWQPRDRKYFLGLAVNNIFNTTIELPSGFTDGGRSVIGTVQVRF